MGTDIEIRYNTARDLLMRPAVQDCFRAVMSSLDLPRFTRIALSSIRKTPKLLECTQASMLSCLLRCAQMDIEPDGQLAALVPYKTECTLVVMYRGYLALAYRNPRIVKVEAHLVYGSDEFCMSLGTLTSPRHDVNVRRAPGEEPIGAYAVAYIRSDDIAQGVPLCEYMTVAEIDEIRKRAPGYDKLDGPHRQHPNEMRRKTVLRRLAKYLPPTASMQAALASDEVPEADVSDVTELAPPPSDDARIAAIVASVSNVTTPPVVPEIKDVALEAPPAPCSGRGASLTDRFRDQAIPITDPPSAAVSIQAAETSAPAWTDPVDDPPIDPAGPLFAELNNLMAWARQYRPGLIPAVKHDLDLNGIRSVNDLRTSQAAAVRDGLLAAKNKALQGLP